MNKLIIGILISFFAFSISAQNTNCEILETAHQLYCAKKYKVAANLLDKTYSHYFESIDSHKTIKVSIVKAFYEAGKYKQVHEIAKSIVSISEYPTENSIYGKEECFSENPRCAGFMTPNRMLVNQHQACVISAKAYLKKKKLAQAFEQIQNADLYYRYWYGCGTTDLENDLKLSLLYAKYFEKSKLPDSAIAKLVKNIFEPAAIPVPFYDEVIKETSRLINKQYSKEERSKIIEQSIDNLYYVSFDSHHGSGESRTYYVKLFGVEIKAAPEYLFEHNMNLEEVKTFLRNTEFYKSIIQ